MTQIFKNSAGTIPICNWPS